MLNAYSRRKDGNALLSRSFRVREFACRDGSDPLFVDSALVQLLQSIRDHFGAPVVITSGYRTAAHNKAVGGAPYSQHCYGRAADIRVAGVPVTFASGLTAAAKDSKHRRTPSELQLRGGSLLCACGNLHQPCDCLLLLYATPCKSQASGKKFIFTSKYILPDITKTALPKQSRKNASEI